MSQTPYPYQSPTPQEPAPDYRSLSELQRPAKAASLLMFIMMGMLLACGAMMALVGVAATPASLHAVDNPETTRQIDQIEKLAQQMHLSFQGLCFFVAAMMLVPGIVYLVLAILVRGAGKAMAILALSFNCLMLLYILLQLMGALFQGAVGPLVVIALPLALLIPIVMALIGAIRNAPLILAARAQFDAHLLQSQQYQQSYAQNPGYGYGYGASTPTSAQPSPAPVDPSAAGAPPVRHPPLPPDSLPPGPQ